MKIKKKFFEDYIHIYRADHMSYSTDCHYQTSITNLRENDTQPFHFSSHARVSIWCFLLFKSKTMQKEIFQNIWSVDMWLKRLNHYLYEDSNAITHRGGGRSGENIDSKVIIPIDNNYRVTTVTKCCFIPAVSVHRNLH